MGDGFGRFDPIGHLGARRLLQTWLGVLVVLHCLWALVALLAGRWGDLAYLAVMLGGLVAAYELSHPAAKLGLLGAWVGWWLVRFIRWPEPAFGFFLLMLASLYVIARVAHAWRVEGTAALRVGNRHALSPTETWPELAGLSKGEKRLLLSRARQHVTSRRRRSTHLDPSSPYSRSSRSRCSRSRSSPIPTHLTTPSSFPAASSGCLRCASCG